MLKIDDTDRKILLTLIERPRSSIAALAEKLGLARNTIYARLNNMEQNGVLKNYDRRVHGEAVGYPLTVFMALSVEQRSLPRVVEDLKKIPEIIQAHGLAGQFDILVRLLCTDSDDLYRLNQLMLTVEGVIRSETWMSVGELIPFRVAPLLKRDLTK